MGNLQHISEREPDDWEEDPSLHPTTETMFMEKSKQSIRYRTLNNFICIGSSGVVVSPGAPFLLFFTLMLGLILSFHLVFRILKINEKSVLNLLIVKGQGWLIMIKKL